jgi:hypothetical protein
MSERDNAVRTQNRTDFDIPSLSGWDLDALPALAGEGWLRARREPSVESNIYIHEDEDRGLRLAIVDEMRPLADPLDSAHPQHVKARGEGPTSGNAETYVVGDFYVDRRKKEQRWTGMNWDGGVDQLRVRLRPEAPDVQTAVVDAREVKELSVDSKGRVTIGAKYAGKDVTVAIVGPTSDDA